MKYEKYSTNTTWEELAGFSRAVKVNNTVYTSGTTVTEIDLKNGITSVKAQSLRCLEIIESALKSFNATKEDIIQFSKINGLFKFTKINTIINL